MCYYKSEVEKYNELMAHYDASFQSINEEIELVKEKFDIMLRKDDALKSIGMANPKELGLQMIRYNEKDALPANLTKAELTEMRWYQRFLSAYNNDITHERFYENGFDYFPTPIITVGEPDKFKFFRWGVIAHFYNGLEKVDKGMLSRKDTLNCISEEMWEKASFKPLIEKAQRCLIPVTGFYEWRWLDAAGTIKIPYYVTFRDQKIRSMAGLYNRWKNPETGEFYYGYTLLTTKANTIMEYVHNAKKRMPVFIDKDNEKAWLDRDLKNDDIMDLCKPYDDPSMRAYTISKMLTTRNINLNVPEVRMPFNYDTTLEEAKALLDRGEKKKAMQFFKESLNAGTDITKADDNHLKLLATQKVKEELTMV